MRVFVCRTQPKQIQYNTGTMIKFHKTQNTYASTATNNNNASHNYYNTSLYCYTNILLLSVLSFNFTGIRSIEKEM